MANDSSSSFGWLICFVILAAAIFFWRFSLTLMLAAVALGIVVWLGYSFLSQSGRAQAAIDGNDFAAALRLLHEGGDDDQLISAVRFRVPFPNQQIKDRMVAVVRELVALKKAAADPANPHIPEALREDIAARTRESLASLWPLCQKLSLITRSKIKDGAVGGRLEKVSGQLEELARKSEATRHQLAMMTLGASELEINVATEQVSAMKWQVNETQKLDELLDG